MTTCNTSLHSGVRTESYDHGWSYAWYQIKTKQEKLSIGLNVPTNPKSRVTKK